jgi:hypothetical protein
MRSPNVYELDMLTVIMAGTLIWHYLLPHWSRAKLLRVQRSFLC